MFNSNKCLVHYCRNNALSKITKEGQLSEQKGFCLDHTPNPGQAKQDIYNYITNNSVSVGLDCCGLVFKNISFSDKKFFGCNFTHCTFQNINCSNTTFRLCICDFAVFNDCSFNKCNIIFSSFSGSTLLHTLLNTSDIIQSNFNGINSYQSSFDDSDLYYSRFIKSKLIDSSFRNCNLKKTIFYYSERVNVSFKLSNINQAIFDVKGSAIELGIEPNEDFYANSLEKESAQ
jgi:uncharacterized protein YjbI with pentapeptide repeats